MDSYVGKEARQGYTGQLERSCVGKEARQGYTGQFA